MERNEHFWNERRSTTLRDVARMVGVSESTVSVVLNSTRSGTRVSAATRRTVLEAAERLGYRPNALARSLQTGRTHRLGFYSGRASLDSRNLFFAELLGGMFEGASEYGANTVVHTSGRSEEHIIEILTNRAVDGLVIHARKNDPILPLLDELRVPAIAVVDRVACLPSVCADDAAGGRLQAKHLANLGHRHVLYKTIGPFAQSAADRQQAFVNAAVELGLRVTVHHDESERDIFTSRDLAVVTEGADRATAVVAWNDSTAEAICAGLDAIGIAIPSDVAVVGFDGFQAFYSPRFPLTTIRAPWAAISRTAVGLLHALIEGDSVPMVATVPVEFVRGGTT